MTNTTWGRVVPGDLVLDPQTELIYLVLAADGYSPPPGFAGAEWVAAKIRHGKDEFDVTKPKDEPVEVTAHSDRVQQQGVGGPFVRPAAEAPTYTGEISRDDPPWSVMAREYQQFGEPIHAPDVTAPDYKPTTQFVCGHCQNRTAGIMHQRLIKKANAIEGLAPAVYCTWPCGHEVLADNDSECPNPEHGNAFASGVQEYVAKQMTEAMGKVIDVAIFSGATGPDDSDPEEPMFTLSANPRVEQAPEVTEKQDAEAAAVQEAFSVDKVELIASETAAETEAREAATMDDPLILPVIDRGLELRSHLYLVHGFYVPDLDPGGPGATAALLEHHRKSHEDGPMVNPHIHKEEGTAS